MSCEKRKHDETKDSMSNMREATLANITDFTSKSTSNFSPAPTLILDPNPQPTILCKL
ncbi:hypothetical protein AC578_7340 [Pseudocercospora eumusae]|uniref:Uncharacterized protein n=1 Tax=Pseudocercospora eumusae TaxID=321146 RepID=A0A139HWE6_9PEZI|nr:hypothetical protein AC578_7340 [Pseudocercospora eumusae]